MKVRARKTISLYRYLALSFSCLLFLGGSVSSSFAQAISGTYAIKNVQTGTLLRPQEANKRDGTPIVLYPPVNWKCVTWDFNAVAPDVYQLQNLFTHKTLQPADAHPKEKTLLEQQPLSASNDQQQWEFIPVAAKVYLIRLKGTALYLTSAEQAGSADAGVELAQKRKGTSQQWALSEQHPTM